MPCRSHRSETGVCSRRWSRRMATFSWAVNRLRVFLAMGKPPLEIVAYSSGPFFPFRLKQNSVGPELRGGPALAASAGASGGEPGWGQDPHPPTSQEGAAEPATLEGIAPSSQEGKVRGVTRRPCSIEHSVQIEHDHSITDRDHVALATVSSFN